MVHKNPYRPPTARGHFLYINFRTPYVYTCTKTLYKMLRREGRYLNLLMRDVSS